MIELFKKRKPKASLRLQHSFKNVAVRRKIKSKTNT
jgi:hypothetical protein